MLLPVSLINAIKEQRAVLFLGTGASYGARHPGNAKLPMGDTLRDLISDRFLGGALKDRSLTAVSAMAGNEVGLLQLQKYIHDLFSPFEPADFHLLLPTFRWKAIVTTNYDLIVERSYKACGSALQTLVKTVKDGDLLDTRISSTTNPVALYKLHGCIDHYEDESIPLILGQEQYASYSNNRQRFYGRLKDLAYEYPIIFCGYSIADPHIQQMLFDLTDKNVKRPMYYHVAPGTNDIEVRYWASHRVSCLSGTFSEFLQGIDTSIPGIARSIPSATGGGTLSIRKYYQVANAAESGALAAYLETDVTHIHSGLVVDHQDPAAFYKGYNRGWGAISQNLDVRREVCDSVLVDAVLTDAETSGTQVNLYMMKGPAGNGKTVALKRIAWDAAITYDQLCLFVSESAGLRYEPLEEIYRLTAKRTFLFVDRVALLREPLLKLLNDCREKKIPITVIGAERDNEWNIYCENLEKYLRQEFSVQYLSEKSIVALLDLLERHRALGLLSNKSPAQRLEAFTDRAEKQLLVALHETTLGLPFETIVLDEYRRIEPTEARRLYLQICALHQFGAPVRAGLISRVLDINFDEFRERLFDPLENVVVIDEVKHGGDLFYRSRHQHVAELVFNQVCVTDDDRYSVLSDLIYALNIDYNSDKETWSRMIRGRAVGHLFVQVEVGRLFYDQAERVAPNESFVSHQRAVFEMQHPGGSLELASAAAQRAFEINGASRSIKHTQAEIARRQAVAAVDPLLKQSFRRLARSKLEGISGRATEYDLSTKARLALDELRELLSSGRDLDTAHQAILLQAAKEVETMIQAGVQAFPESSDLLSVEASFRELLAQAGRAHAALTRAFQLNPRQDWLAVRLARSYQDNNDFAGAMDILEKCLNGVPSSKIAHLEMGRVALALGKPRALVLDHLRRSFTNGDTNFEGQFSYARELFQQGQLDAAKAVFTALNSNAPGRFRTSAAAPILDENKFPSEFRGSVVRKEEGYAFVHLVGIADNIFASKSDSLPEQWANIRGGSDVRGQVAFNRRGPRLIKVSIDS